VLREQLIDAVLYQQGGKMKEEKGILELENASCLTGC